jgi:hypothetical protein
MRLAEAGIAELQKAVDTLLIIPNQNLFRVATRKPRSLTPSRWPIRFCMRVWPESPT